MSSMLNDLKQVHDSLVLTRTGKKTIEENSRRTDLIRFKYLHHGNMDVYIESPS